MVIGLTNEITFFGFLMSKRIPKDKRASSINVHVYSTVWLLVSTLISGAEGDSNYSVTPIKSLMMPALALP